MDIITHDIDCETAEQAAITCRILTKNNLAFEEVEFLPISGIRTARFIISVKTHQHYNILRNGFIQDINDTIQIDGDKKHRYNWVGNKAT